MQWIQGIGSEKAAAPQARLMATVVNGILGRKLPWGLVLLGVFLVIAVELLGIRSLSFAVGSYLSIATTLAIFTGEDRAHACAAALDAALDARQGVAELNERRGAQGQPVTDMYLGLHVGKVFYGNVGSRERLDFTVLGPAVNEASRIAAMCRSVDQPVLLSASFAAVDGMKRRLVSVGRYALRGVSHPQELFTIDPDR